MPLNSKLALKPTTSASFLDRFINAQESIYSMPFVRILVVEDYEPVRRFICLEVQRRAEFQVIGEVSDGLGAVRQAQQLQPDVILLDIGLPKLNGIEAARQIRKLAPDAKLLFVSQESSSDIVRETFNLGGLGYVHKLRAKTDLLPAIDAVHRGERFVSAGLEFSESTDSQVPYRHEILFCSEESILLEALAQFIATALNAGNPAIVWATESHRKTLLHTLLARGVDIEVAIQRGTYIASDAAETLDPVRIIETINGLSEAALKGGKKHPRVAVCGERAGRLWAEGKIDVAMRIEQFCNQLAKSHDIDILCPYPLPIGQEDDQAFKNICAEHTLVISR
jgi:DNA-binding NarL/FixJ family response regulator